MNTFASLERVFALKKVTFYTVRLEGAQRTLWEQFLDDHEDEQFDDDLNILRSALVRIGNETGARSQFFRFEAARGGDARTPLADKIPGRSVHQPQIVLPPF